MFAAGALFTAVELQVAYGPDAAWMATGHYRLAHPQYALAGWLVAHLSLWVVNAMAVLLSGMCFAVFYRFVEHVSESRGIALAALGIAAAYVQFVGTADALLNAPVQLETACLLYLIGLVTLQSRPLNARFASTGVVVALSAAVLCAPDALYLFPLAALVEMRFSQRASFPTRTAVAVILSAVCALTFHLRPTLPTTSLVLGNIFRLLPGVGTLDAGVARDVVSDALHDVTFINVSYPGVMGWVVALAACAMVCSLWTARRPGNNAPLVFALLVSTLVIGNDLELMRWLAAGAALTVALAYLRSRQMFAVAIGAVLITVFFGTYGSLRADNVIAARLHAAWRDLLLLDRGAAAGLFRPLSSGAHVMLAAGSALVPYFGGRDATKYAREYGCCISANSRRHVTWQLDVVTDAARPLPNVTRLVEVRGDGLAARGFEYEEFWDSLQVHEFESKIAKTIGLKATLERPEPTHVLLLAQRVCGAVSIAQLFNAQVPRIIWGPGFYHAVSDADRPFNYYPALLSLSGDVHGYDIPLRFAREKAEITVPAGCEGHRAVIDAALVAYAPGTLSRTSGRLTQRMKVSQAPTNISLYGSTRRPTVVRFAFDGSSSPPDLLSGRLNSVPMESTAFAVFVTSAYY